MEISSKNFAEIRAVLNSFKSVLTEVDGIEITSHSTQFHSLFSVTGGEGVTGQAYNDYLLC